MRVNPAGLQIIKGSEDLRLKAYLCPAGKWTIGWGHTGIDVYEGLVITEDEAERLLAADVKFTEDNLSLLLPAGLTRNQFSALVSLVFNIGVGNFVNSTLFKKLRLGEMAAAANEFPRWNKARVKGDLVPLDGLTKRRAKERELFLAPDPEEE